MNEEIIVESECSEGVCKPKKEVRKKRDIFRFKGQEDMSINLEHVYKIVKNGKRITFQSSRSDLADYVDFDDEESCDKAIEQILAIWSAEAII